MLAWFPAIRRCTALAVASTSLAVVAGCHGLPRRGTQPASVAALPDAAPEPRARITKRQSADIKVAIGRAAEAGGKPADAEAAYRAALQADPNRSDAEARLAVLTDQRGDSAAADQHFARALQLEPRNAVTLADRGYSYYLRRRWAEAEVATRDALAIDPRSTQGHANLALILTQQRQIGPALAEFAQAGVDPADARANVGLILAMEGDLAGARQQYALALQSKPDSEAARAGLKATDAALVANQTKPRTIADPAVQRASAATAKQ